MRKRVLVFFLLLNLTWCFTQEGAFISGQLVDITENEPIPFATIKIKDRALGVISNSDGTFKIPMKFQTLGEVLEISCMGFQSKEVPVQDFDASKSNRIVLSPTSFELTEAVVTANLKKLTAREIVNKAVNKIPYNYPQDTFNLVGYYRDYQVKNSQYTNLNEAVIRVFDDGFDYQDNSKNRYQLLSYKRNPDFEIDVPSRQPYDYHNRRKIVPNAKMINDGGNEFITLSIHDAIRNYGKESFSFIDNIATDFVKNHKFILEGTTNFKNEAVYDIYFTFDNTEYTAEGHIYIGRDDFAILKLEYSVFKIRNPKDFIFAVNSSERYSDGFNKMNRELIYNIKTAYVRGLHGKMFLNYISFYNKLLIQRSKGFSSRFALDLNDNVFKIRVNNSPIKLDKIKPNDFKIFYRSKRVPIKEFDYLEDERTFIVVPNWKNEKTKDVLANMFTERKDLTISDITYSYKGIKDSLGNSLDERKWEYLHQYREFFVQEAGFNYLLPILDNLMINSLPLDNKKQPMFDDAMRNEYWMNTPLKGSNTKKNANE